MYFVNLCVLVRCNMRYSKNLWTLICCSRLLIASILVSYMVLGGTRNQYFNVMHILNILWKAKDCQIKLKAYLDWHSPSAVVTLKHLKMPSTSKQYAVGNINNPSFTLFSCLFWPEFPVQFRLGILPLGCLVPLAIFTLILCLWAEVCSAWSHTFFFLPHLWKFSKACHDLPI